MFRPSEKQKGRWMEDEDWDLRALSVSLRMQTPSQVEGGVLKSPEPASHHSDGFLVS